MTMTHNSRRRFIRQILTGGAALASVGCIFRTPGRPAISKLMASPSPGSPAAGGMMDRMAGVEARHYTKLNRNRVRCDLCYHSCHIASGRRGLCKNRENEGGSLFNVVYGKPSAVHIDPVEKEPQLHMLPGSQILCIGTAGCNFKCRHCHNWHLSQRSIEEIGMHYDYSPDDIVNAVLELGLPTISFTYNEPTVFYEYVFDIAKKAQESGIRILWHTNAYMKPEPLQELLPYTDAITVDLKGFSQHAYDNSSAKLDPVLQTLKLIKESGTWFEIVNLVIPTINDSNREIRRMCEWMVSELSHEVPLHFSRFFPNYQLTRVSATPIQTLERARAIALESGLHYITIGNVPGHEHNSTICPKCDGMLIRRLHFQVMENNIRNGRCNSCSHPIPGIWS